MVASRRDEEPVGEGRMIEQVVDRYLAQQK